jgi:hypothetical protein
MMEELRNVEIMKSKVCKMKQGVRKVEGQRGSVNGRLPRHHRRHTLGDIREHPSRCVLQEASRAISKEIQHLEDHFVVGMKVGPCIIIGRKIQSVA